jgi:prolyl-tRNA synthetase
MRVDDGESMEVAEAMYKDLRHRRIDVLLDDRKARPGVKFADAELIGVPYRVTIGPRGLAEGQVELTPRLTGETESLDTAVAVDRLTSLVLEAR